MTEKILWTDALEELEAEGIPESQARVALGTLLDGELELPQEDDQERVITRAELDRVRGRLDSDE